MKIIIDREKPLSWNKYWSGMHFMERKEEADRVHTLVKYSIVNKIMFIKPVDIIFTVYFAKRMYDCDNIACKPYIDGLKGIIIQDDTPRYVKSVKTISLKDKENPRVEIEIL